MSPTVPRDSLEGRIYNDLRNLARCNGCDPAEYYTRYALEGFLTRLTQSTIGDMLVLKGGILMAAYSDRRPTRDIDLSATGLPNDIKTCEEHIHSIMAIECDDGLIFDFGSVKSEAIRDESDYPGIRIHISARLAVANLHFHVDVNFGDPIYPNPTSVTLPLLLGGKIEILAYPLCMLLAEKIVTAIDRGIANTRWRDLLDIARIANSQTLSSGDLIIAIETVSTYRSVDLLPLSIVLEGMPKIAQQRWAIWRKKQNLESESPESFEEMLETIIRFADPVIENKVAGLMWQPDSDVWA